LFVSNSEGKNSLAAIQSFKSLINDLLIFNFIALNVNEPLLFIKPCYKLGCFGLKIWR
jgi:hypothetical protein